jgi:hypothetical protein
LYSDRARARQIAVFFVRAKNSIAVPLSSKHLRSGKSLFGLVPLLGEFENPPEDLELANLRKSLEDRHPEP